MSINHKDDVIEWIEVDLDEVEEPVVYKNSDVEQEESTADKAVRNSSNALREVFSYAVVIVVAVIASLVISRFVIINASIPSSSMATTVNKGDLLFGYRLSYLFAEPERGDIVIFQHKCYENKAEDTYIKRIIGVPGDKVEIIDGVLYINDVVVEEDYISQEMSGNYGPFNVPEDSYLMFGDNRPKSDDARFWDNTYVKREDILAKAIFRYYPTIDMLE